MSGNTQRSVYVGNLDERVSERVLYDILIQAGRLVDLYVPRDKETARSKGYAFAEYETEEIAEYAVRLFSGLVTLYNRTLKFAISGKDKLLPNLSVAVMPASNSPLKPRLQPPPFDRTEDSEHSTRLSTPGSFSDYPVNYSEVPVSHGLIHHSNGYGSNYDGYDYGYSRRVLGAALDSFTRTRSSRYDASNPITHSSY
ncbi:uncharacterized protein LOC131161292 [Malania oleifera]|uniref:uncharacterized protein LOC131161292 n=1 Tax=Malania oleifera TaxID=397392 RepID=UPI0025AE4CCA|nr:uncharacterized protein LOC131161292 [Malania oleifera]